MYVTVVSLLVSLPALAGTTLVWERSGAALTMRCEGENARIEGAAGTVIWSAASKTLIVLRPVDKTYTQLTEAQLNALKERSDQKLAELRAKVASDPEKRTQLEANLALGGLSPTATKLEPKATGRQSKVGAWKCELYEADSGSLHLTWCLVPWASAPAKRDELACLSTVARLMGQIARGVDAPAEDFTQLPGLAVETARQGPDGRRAVSTLKAIERGQLPGDTFAAPPGYTLKPPPGAR